MSAKEYRELLDRAAHLNVEEQRRLLADLAAIVRDRSSGQARRSILELKGLGKDCWKGVDVQEYLEQERSSWSG